MFYGLRRTLRLNGLLNNKHIPEIYQRASIRQRLELLAGLIDTDRHVDCEDPASARPLEYRIVRFSGERLARPHDRYARRVMRRY